MEDFLSKPDIGAALNDRDHFTNLPAGIYEYSEPEKQILIKCINHKRNSLNVIVEIGVDRAAEDQNTQTKTWITNKNAETKYFGFDLCPRHHVTSYAPNCFFHQNDSADIQNNIKILEQNGAATIDILFIDGWHSVNQVYKEWAWTQYLSEDGIVVLHDTNYHPGPKEVLSKLNTSKWAYKKFCEPPLKCWGVAVAWKTSSEANRLIASW